MSMLNSVQMAMFQPAKLLVPNLDVDPAEITLCESALARLISLAQLVISVIALPVILLVGLVEAAIRARKGEGCEALAEMGSYLKSHALIGIPTSFIGIFAPLATTGKVYAALKSAFENTSSNDEIDVEEIMFGKEFSLMRELEGRKEYEASLMRNYNISQPGAPEGA